MTDLVPLPDPVEPDDFWEKLKNSAKKAGKEVVEKALTLFYCFQDPDTPGRAKLIISSALLYFILPMDAVSDFLPGGFVDDLGALAGAMMAVAAHIKESHKAKAAEQLKRWFGENQGAA